MTEAKAVEKKKAAKLLEPQFGSIVSSGINLVVTPSEIYPTSTFGTVPFGLGLPIMPEGFITDTGILPPR